jgi:hypothetical protein
LKGILTIFAFLLISANAFAFADSLLKINIQQRYPYEVIDFTADNLGNIYLLGSSNQIKKINERGDSLAVYNDVRRYGKVSFIDASNPLKILVFYKDYSTIVVLDRMLNVRNTIRLRQQNIMQVRALTSSYDNNIWLFDEVDSKLKKIDDNGRVLLESVDFRQAFKDAPVPESMFDKDGQLYLYDSKKGLFVFDYYAAQKQKHTFPIFTDLQVVDKNTITGRDSSHVLLYKPATFQLYSFSAFNKMSDYKKVWFNNKKVYALRNEGGLELYLVK